MKDGKKAEWKTTPPDDAAMIDEYISNGLSRSKSLTEQPLTERTGQFILNTLKEMLFLMQEEDARRTMNIEMTYESGGTKTND